MNIKSLILIFLLSFSAAQAEDAKIFLKNYNEANESATKAYTTKTLATVYNDNFLVEDHSKSFNKMIAKISEEISQRLASKSGSLDPDMCSSSCARYGTSELRMRLFFEVSTKIDLSKETRECQNVCKVYFSGYFSYLDGFKDAQAKRSAASSDCSGSVATGSRSSKPSVGVDPSDLEKFIKTSSGVSK